MGSTGDRFDNAVAESFFATSKSSWPDGHPRANGNAHAAAGPIATAWSRPYSTGCSKSPASSHLSRVPGCRFPLQKELIGGRSWPSKAELRTEVFAYIEVFLNRRRRHSTLGFLSPAQFESHHQHQDEKITTTATVAA